MALVAVHMTDDSVAYMTRLLDGAVMGTPGSIAIDPKIQLIVDALYHVLAGGTVAGTVPGTLTVTAGLLSEVADLRTMEASCTANINAVNGTVRFSLVMEF